VLSRRLDIFSEPGSSQCEAVPEIGRFFGIVIAMFYADHAPPHFHARYGEHRAIIDIESSALLGGALPSRSLGLVVEWATQHRAELRENWMLAPRQEPLLPVAPLE
jgi:Domain of unknown function (DUF4160)